MADLKKVEVENALKSQIELIDKLYLRKLQKVMFECAAKCCDNSQASAKEVQYCVDKCNNKLTESHNYVTSEIQNYQVRLQRCVSECNDQAKDQMGTSPSEAQVEKASKFFENCACKCIDKHIDVLPQFMKRVHEVMGKKVEAATGVKVPEDQILST